MAMLKTDGSLVEQEGKFGGTIFRSDQCRQHAQSYPRLISHRSAKQKARRRCFSKLSTIYLRKYATVQFAHQWQAYSNNFPRRSKKGDVYCLPWWQKFISVNLNRCMEGKVILLVPPW